MRSCAGWAPLLARWPPQAKQPASHALYLRPACSWQPIPPDLRSTHKRGRPALVSTLLLPADWGVLLYQGCSSSKGLILAQTHPVLTG